MAFAITDKDEMFPYIQPKQLKQSAAPWGIGQLAFWAFDDGTGLNEHAALFVEKSMEKRSDLPMEFFNHQLKELAEGTDERVRELSEEYGILYSPKRDDRECTKKFQDYLLGLWSEDIHNIEESEEIYRGHLEYPVSRTDAIRCEAIDYGAKKELQEGYDIISLQEIRDVAKKLLNIVKIIQAIDRGEKASDVAKELLPTFAGLGYGYGYNALKNAIDYLNTCMSEVRPELDLGLWDGRDKRFQKPEHVIEIVAEYDEEPKTIGRIDFSDLFIEKRMGTLTEAVAVQIYNAAIALHIPWRTCQHCGTEFKVKQPSKSSRGKGRIRVGDTRYCCPACQNAALQARYRERKRKQAIDRQKGGASL